VSDYQVGFIGIGNMGWPMAKNLLKAGHNILKSGHKLAVHDLDRARVAKFAAEEGNAVAAESAAALAKASNVIVTMLPTGPIVRDVMQGLLAEGALKPGTVVIDMSSSEPLGTKQLSDILAKAGVALVDSPVSGGVPGAQAGTLTLMVGGDDAAAIERAWPVLQTMGAKLFRTGASGSGDTMKALNNFVAGANFRAVSEALAMGVKFGLDPNLIIDVLNVSTGRSFTSEGAFKTQVLSGKYAAGFALGLLTKDLKIAADLAGDLGVMAPMCSVVYNAFANAREGMGYSADFTAAHKYWTVSAAK
jgi:3-hydroxyisobutyrate dehydrogenase